MDTAQPETGPVDGLLEYIKRSRGFDFSGYKRASLTRRIHKRLQALSISRFDDYSDYLEVHPEEFTQLFNTILINVTNFFRDTDSWHYLETEILPRILENKPENLPIRCWSAGCATGEEAYSIAMLLAEVLGEAAFKERVKIYATDMDEEALVKARSATYTEREVENVPRPLLEKYFDHNGKTYSFHKELRRNVIFGQHDLIKDAAISRVDLLVCRNVLMYFNSEVQAKVLSRFHFALLEKGFLFLGKAEMLLTHADLFTPVAMKQRIFTKVARNNLRERLLAMTQPDSDDQPEVIQPQFMLREIAFDVGPVAQAVIDSAGLLLLTNELARRWFALSTRDHGRHFQDLQLSYRPVEIRSAIDQAMATQSPVVIKGVDWNLSSIDQRVLDVYITPLVQNGSGVLGVNLTFLDVSHDIRLQHELESTRQELETALEEVQSTIEELETTNEELQSTNEELETTNEELQSTNEELETMNEELQSTNEELETINGELRVRTEALNRANAFLEAILLSLRGGVVVLDRDLHVQVWNQRCADLWGLRSEEVVGENFLNLDIGLPVEQLKRPIRQVATQELEATELQVAAVNRRGRSIRTRVTCLPLRTGSKEILGVILVMEDVTEEVEHPGGAPAGQ